MEQVKISFHDIQRKRVTVGPIPLKRGGELLCEFRQLFNSEQAFIAQKAEKLFETLQENQGVLPESGPLVLTPGEKVIHVACLLEHMNLSTSKQKYTWQEWVIIFDTEEEAFGKVFDELNTSLLGEASFLAVEN